MSVLVPRTVTVVDGDADQTALPLADFRSEHAYVLLGDPGAGKTTAFETEADADSDGQAPVTALHFTRLDQHAERSGKTLFIDALDEFRAGSADARQPLAATLERLVQLGRPPFRLSCRSADWLGRTDLKGIVTTAGYEAVTVLHLDPLRESDIREILTGLAVTDPEDFIAEARDRGLAELLQNPHLLNLLATAVGKSNGDWPDGRFATFAKACELSVREYNDEHQAANHNAPPVSVERILHAAGHLSALLLLSARESIRLDERLTGGAISLSDVRGVGDPSYAHALRRAVKSPLFTGPVDHGRTPMHRQIAEFLGARYLHALIDEGLLPDRVLALMAGSDGIVVSELRGLAAWLAAFNQSVRPTLIEADPVGTAMHGDVRRFQADELERLLRTFAERADEIQVWTWPDVALGSLIHRQTVQTLAEYLTQDDRSEGRQAVVYLLLTALSRATAHPLDDATLTATIRDASWGAHVRIMALRALLRRASESHESAPDLLTLLNDLRHGRVQDRNHELMGLLLAHLYPTQVSPVQVWDYLLPHELPLGGSYGFFWRRSIIDKTADGRLALVEALASRGAEWLQARADDRMLPIVHKLVCGALHDGGDDVDSMTILSWLDLIGLDRFVTGRQSAALSTIRKWLAARPDIQKALLLDGLVRYDGQDDLGYRAFHLRWSICGAGTPADFEGWCLEQAVAFAHVHRAAALQLLVWSGPWQDNQSGPGLSVTEVRAATAGLPILRREVERLASSLPATEDASQIGEEDEEHDSAQSQEQAQLISFARARIEELRRGTCVPGLLGRIAHAYYDPFDEQHGGGPEERVCRFFNGDIELTQAALAGFRRVLDREDFPSLRELIRLDEGGRMSSLALPALAGLELLGRQALRGRPADDILRGVGLYYLTGADVMLRNESDTGPGAWYHETCRSHPRLVAKAMIKVTRSRIRNKNDCHYLWPLARNTDYREVTRVAAPSLWRAFPTKCTAPQLSALKHLLRASLRWEAEGMAEAIDERLPTDLDAAQRALWLAAGLFVSARDPLPDLVSFIAGGEETRCHHVVAFLAEHDDEGPLSTTDWDTPRLRALIELVGRTYSPWLPEPGAPSFRAGGDGRMRAERLMRGWAKALSRRTDAETGAALDALSEDGTIAPWHDILHRSRDQHIVARRTALFSIPSFDAVQETLVGGLPANAADLAASIVATLEAIADYVRNANTDGWRQFWDECPDGARPMHENRCRDRLLDALRRKLPSRIDAQPEGQYAENKRADIRVSYDGIAIPIEIKKDRHRDVRRAARDQLAARYTRDPDSDGYGIYLVLWFGLTPPTAQQPASPDDLRDQLRDGLDDRLRHKIKILVLDLSRPPTK